MKNSLYFFILLFQFSIGQNDTSIEGNTKKNTFQVIETTPVFPGCENKKIKAQKKCMSSAIQRHIKKKYRADILEELNLPPGRITVFSFFKVDKNGNVVEIKAKGPHPKLEEEAIRVITLLPKMKPGYTNGKPIIIPYSIPIYLKIDETRLTKKEKRKLKKLAKQLLKKSKRGIIIINL